MYIYIYTHVDIYICTYIYVCVGVGVCIYKCKFTMNRIVRLSILGTEKARASKYF